MGSEYSLRSPCSHGPPQPHRDEGDNTAAPNTGCPYDWGGPPNYKHNSREHT